MNNEANQRKNFWRDVILSIVFVLVGLLIFGFGLMKATRNSWAVQTVSLQSHRGPRETTQPNKGCEGPEIEMFCTQLAFIPRSDLPARKNVEGKIAAWETKIAICESVTPATGIPNTRPQFTPWTPTPFKTGVFEGQPGAYFHAFEAKIENHWKGIIVGNRVTVFAGAWVNDPSQGFIAVQTAPARGQAVWGYYSPGTAKTGALRIVDAKGARLVIQQANDNKMLFFDVPSLSFVGSLEEEVLPATATTTLAPVQTAAIPYPYPVP